MRVYPLKRGSQLWSSRCRSVSSGVFGEPALFLVRGAHNRSASFSSLGVVVSRRIGGSVVRQKVKRRFRHSFFEACRCFQSSFECVVVIKSDGVLTIPFCDLVTYFSQFLQKPAQMFLGRDR